MAAPDFEISFDWEIVEAMLDRMGVQAEHALAQLALEAANIAEGAIRAEIVARLTQRPTGALARDVRSVLVQASGRVVEARVELTRPYARIQNDGGVITAHGKKLTVPLSFANVPIGKAAGDWSPRLTLIPRKGADAILAMVSRNGKVEPKYVLKDRVRIPGVHYMEAAEAKAAPEIEELIARKLDELMQRAGAR